MSRIVKKPEERRREIVQAARELFLRNEYENTSMQDVIAELGIAKGTIYHYFKSKEELLHAVVEDIVEEYLESLRQTLQEAEGNALERMRALIASGNIAASKAGIIEQLHQPGNSLLHTRLLAVTITRIAPLYASLIEQGCREGLFRTAAPLETAEFILAGIQCLTDTGLFPWSEEILERRRKAVAVILEAQLQAARGSFNFLIAHEESSI